MNNINVPVCPFSFSSNDIKMCANNCQLNINGECSIKVIAEKLIDVKPHTDSGK